MNLTHFYGDFVKKK